MILESTLQWRSFLQDGAARKRLENEILPQFLQTKRWFGAKSSKVKKYEIEIALIYESEGLLVHMLMFEVTFETANSDTYQVPLAFRMEEDFEKEGLIGKASFGGKEGYLVEAFCVPAFRESLFQQIAHAQPMDVQDGTLEFENGSGLDWQTGDPVTSRLLNVEQSNTTIVFNEEYFLKIYRKLYRDLNPDYEVSRFLTEKTEFRQTPQYSGAINWSKPGFYKITIGLMQRKVENKGDIWPHFLRQVERFFSRMEVANLDPDDLPKVPLYKPVKPIDLPSPYLELFDAESIKNVQLLARRTAELHLALFWEKTEAQFRPIPYSEDYTVWLQNRVLYMLDHRITTMEAVMDKLSPKARAFAEEFLERKVEVKNRILTFDETLLNSSRIRIHGDYHLGQVLSSDGDLVILDFEGEPEATIRDRKVKHSPLKDVAGMMRSFHYSVFATIFSEHKFKMSEAELSTAGGRYYRAIVAVFLDTYLNVAFDNGLDIGYSKEIDFLLRYHIFEKAIYELGYELNSRPDWVIIPLKGLNQILNND